MAPPRIAPKARATDRCALSWRAYDQMIATAEIATATRAQRTHSACPLLKKPKAIPRLWTCVSENTSPNTGTRACNGMFIQQSVLVIWSMTKMQALVIRMIRRRWAGSSVAVGESMILYAAFAAAVVTRRAGRLDWRFVLRAE